jgi:hypothetical protein
MDKEYFISEELLDVLHSAGLIKTEEEIKAEEETEKKEENTPEDEDTELDECPVYAELKDMKDAITTMNESLITFGKVLKEIAVALNSND